MLAGEDDHTTFHLECLRNVPGQIQFGLARNRNYYSIAIHSIHIFGSLVGDIARQNRVEMLHTHNWLYLPVSQLNYILKA